MSCEQSYFLTLRSWGPSCKTLILLIILKEDHVWGGHLEHWLSGRLGCLHPVGWLWVGLLTQPANSSSLQMQTLGNIKWLVCVAGFLVPTWKAWTGAAAPGLDLAQSNLSFYGHPGEESADGSSVYLSLSVVWISDSQVNKLKRKKKRISIMKWQPP